MKAKRTFQDKLRSQILRNTTLIIAIFLLLFLGSLVFYDYSLMDSQAANVNDYLTSLFMDTYSDYEDYLTSTANNKNYQDFILENKNESSIFHSYYIFNKDRKIKSNLVISDYYGDILLQTFNIKRDNNYFISFNNMIRDKILNSKSLETGLYSFIETSSEFVVSGPIYKEGRIIGFVSLYMNGDDWNYELSAQEYNGVITDKFGNVIASSSKMIISNMNKFKPEMKNARVEILGSDYVIKHTQLESQEINIYTLVKVRMNIYQYLTGAFIILVLGLAMLIITGVFSKKIAFNNSKSINKLLNEIYIIKDRNLDYKINLNTDDEIEIIAESVNDLVLRINTLNKRNTELINLKRISEIKQLEAQFNPHFLYNTLETIRYAMLYDRKTASDLINLLTQVLRYSIMKGSDEVKFSENLEYTMVFLRIYKYRFDNNFSYTIDVSDECNDILVPKLLLQPILENSIKYGYIKKALLSMEIRARVEGDYLIIVVEDNGSGISEEELTRINRGLHEEDNTSNHFGLFNTARRLLLQFGSESGIQVKSSLGQGTKVIIRIKKHYRIEKPQQVGDLSV